LVTIRPFWSDNSSFGKPCKFHSRIVVLSTNMLTRFTSCQISNNKNILSLTGIGCRGIFTRRTWKQIKIICSFPDLSHFSHKSSSLSLSSLSPSNHPSVFHLWLKTYSFQNSCHSHEQAVPSGLPVSELDSNQTTTYHFYISF